MNQVSNTQLAQTSHPWHETIDTHPHGFAAGAAHCLSFFRTHHSESSRNCDGDYDYMDAVASVDSRSSEGSRPNSPGNLIHVGLSDVTNGSDFIPTLLALSVANESSILLIGAKGAAEHFTREIVFKPDEVDNGHTTSTQTAAWRDAGLIEDINKSHAQVIVLGINVPLQKDWVIRHRSEFQFARVIVANGIIIDLSAGGSLRGNHATRLGRLFRV